MTEPPAPPETAPPLDLEGMKARWAKWPEARNLASLVAVPALLAEVERLRGLLERLHEAEMPRAGEDGDECWYCHAPVSALGRIEHDAGCPWPELEAAVLSWRKPGP